MKIDLLTFYLNRGNEVLISLPLAAFTLDWMCERSLDSLLISFCEDHSYEKEICEEIMKSRKVIVDEIMKGMDISRDVNLPTLGKCSFVIRKQYTNLHGSLIPKSFNKYD